MNQTLVIAPHMDDEAISCGGLIQARVAAGGQVYVFSVYGRRYGIEKVSEEAQRLSDDQEQEDFNAACAKLGCQNFAARLPEGEPHQFGYYPVLGLIEAALQKLAPDEVVIPASDDLNQDHRFLNHVAGIALRPVNLGRVLRILEFFALDGSVKQPSYFVTLTEAQVQTKLAAIAAYRREARTGTSPRAPQNVEAQMRVWGAACGSSFAEGYRLKFAREQQDEGRNHGVVGVHRDQSHEVPGEDRT